MGRSKAKTLYWIWKKYRDLRWGEKLKEVGVVTQEDVNGFLRLVGGRDKDWYSWELGDFVSKVLKYCYERRFIELDVGLVGGRIAVGRELDWDGVIYVRGNVNCSIGSIMKGGMIIVEGVVEGDVGGSMKGGFIYVSGEVKGRIGHFMVGGEIYVEGDVGRNIGASIEGGVIVVDGDVGEDVGWFMKGGDVIVKGDVWGRVGHNMKGGMAYVEGNVEEDVGYRMENGVVIVNGHVREVDWSIWLGKGVVNCNGIWYFSRWVE